MLGVRLTPVRATTATASGAVSQSAISGGGGGGGGGGGSEVSWRRSGREEPDLAMYDCFAGGRRVSFDETLARIGLDRASLPPEAIATVVGRFYGCMTRKDVIVR